MSYARSDEGVEPNRSTVYFICLLMAACSSPTALGEHPASPSSASNTQAIIAFYDDADKVINDGDGCGDFGYPKHYGERYARRFLLETEPKLSSAGKIWVRAAALCMTRRLEPFVVAGITCEEFERTAFGTHGACYIESGFCNLPSGDLLKVSNTIERDDRRDQLARFEIQKVAKYCSAHSNKASRRSLFVILERRTQRKIARNKRRNCDSRPQH